MDNFTYAYIKQKIQRDLDLEEESFISADELLQNVNEAIDRAEAIVHTLYEDYFLTNATLAMVSGTKQYALPTNIYLQKIRGVIYNNGGDRTYMVKRLRFDTMFEDMALIDKYPTDNFYKYVLVNDATLGMRMELYPTPNETNNFIKIWYIRNAKRLALDADVCDLPDICAHFVIAEAKVLCLKKEPGNPMYADAIAERDRLEKIVEETLMSRVPDEDNEVKKDFTHYEEMS